MRVESTAPTINAIDLFCGVGGLTHGLTLGGINVKAGYDIDSACKYPYEINNSAKFVECDVAQLSADVVRRDIGESGLTLLAGCAPCQPFSTYSRSGRGKRSALDWRLVSKFGRLVQEIKPELVTMENVSQLAEHSVFEDFLSCLSSYDINWSVVECSALGVPQSRRRLVLLASQLGASHLKMPTRAGTASTVRDAIYDLPRISAGEQHSDDQLHKASALSPLNLKRIQASVPGGTWRDWDPGLRALCHDKPTGATYPSVYGSDGMG